MPRKIQNRSPGDGDPRQIAARVLTRVDSDGAYASLALDAELGPLAQLDSRDRGLATELVYGTLRSRGSLESRLAPSVPRGLAKVEPWVRAHLLIAAYQILILDRVPDFAAVDAAVGAVSFRRGSRVGGFVNAVLRKLCQQERLERTQAVLESAPSWLLKRLTELHGSDEAATLLGADTSPPPKALRMRTARAIPKSLVDASPGRASPLCRVMRGCGDPRSLPGYDEGEFVVQEEGAQVVGLALGALPGERVLDACAGHGNKAALLAERVGSEGQVWVCDRYPTKLRKLAAEFSRLQLPQATSRAVDWTRGVGDVPRDFQRVLVDAPCSGVGTLRRRPEILRRLEPTGPERIAEQSLAILRAAASRAPSGGRVVYAVCSVLPEEGEKVVQAAADVLESVPFDAPELIELCGPSATQLTLLPGRHGTDGYFIASLRVK